MQQYIHGRPLAMICVAAPEDATLLGQWESHLRLLEQARLISCWSDQHLAPGADRVQAFQHQLAAADLVLLLLSADFFNASDCLAMMEQTLQRAQIGAVRVIPLLLRPVAWQESSFAELAPWPSNGVPITQWGNQDAAWDACVQSLRRLLGRRVSEALSSERAQKQTDPDWERMLRRLRRSYKELLDQSLHGIPWMELGLSTRPDMVRNITNLLFRLLQGSERLLPPGTSILDAYDEAEGELLILGAPGAGKSTLLLDLAQQLVSRTQASEIHQLPVILRLSSWAVRQAELAEWMVEQLSQTYNVPPKLSEQWVKEGRVLPLLDGLDEMEVPARPACIATINAYHRTHLAPLVICSRQAEYEATIAQERLALQAAVVVQPLSNEQIEGYLQTAASTFAGVRAALYQHQALWELATTPLMLSVLLQTYRDFPVEAIMSRETDLEQQVWTDYVARQMQEKGNVERYPLDQTRSWLNFLAQQMQRQSQPEFYIDRMQPNILVDHRSRRIYHMIAVKLLSGIQTGFTFGILGATLAGAFSLVYNTETRFAFYVSLFSGLSVGIFFLGYGLTKGLYTTSDIHPVEIIAWSFTKRKIRFTRALIEAMIVNSMLLALFSLFFAFTKYPINLLHAILVTSLITCIITPLTYRWKWELSRTMLKEDRLEKPNQGIQRSTQNGIIQGLIVGLSIGLVAGYIGGMFCALIFGVGFGIAGAFSNGVVPSIQHAILRWLLYRAKYIPWNYAEFLDDATKRILLRRVGSGYSFIHRRLQDYFADAPVPPLQS